MRLSSEERLTSTSSANPSNVCSAETRNSTSGLKRIIEVRLQPLTRLNLQAQLPRTRQGQRQRQHDSTHPQFEKLPCCLVGDDDGHPAVFQDALAHDYFAPSSDLE